MSSIGVYGAALLLMLITLWILKWRNPKCNGKLPPGSLGLPLIGETIQFCIPSKSIDMTPFFKKRIIRYGPVFKTSLVGRPVVIFSDPDFSNFILQQEGKLVEMWYMDSFAEFIGQNAELKNVITAGSVYKQFKKLVAEYFGNERLKGIFLPQMEAMINDALNSWTTKESVEVHGACSAMMLNFTAKLLFGYDPENCEINLSETLPSFMKLLLSFPLNIPGTTFHKCSQNRKKVQKMIKEEVEKRRASPSKTTDDFLDWLIGHTLDNGNSLPDNLIVSVIFVLFFAATETIPFTLTLVIKFLSELPSVMGELVKENEEIIRSRDDKESGISWSEYKSMDFTMLVINEALRMTGSGWLLRRTIEDVHINGYTIPRGWTIAVVPAALHMNPDIYKDPLAFNPWRWKDLRATIKAKNFIPFGGGMRTCGGADFSRGFLAVFLHLLVTKFRWTKLRGGEIIRNPMLGFGEGYHIKVSKRPKMQPEN